MATVRPLRPEVIEPPALHDRAIDNLRFIRETMERAGSFTAISGWGIVATGVAALAASAAARLAGSEALWVAVWVAAAVLCAIISSWATVRKAKRSGEPMISGPARKLALSFSPPMIVGALLTLVLVRMSLTELLPGVWLSIYGTAVVAGGAYSVRIVPVMGFCFMALGAVALFAPAGLGDWLMALGFGGLHVVFGIQIARRHGG